MNGIANRVRKEQTEGEFLRLKRESMFWWDARDAADTLKQYRTQLNAIKRLLEGAVNYLQQQLDALDLNMTTGDFYEECRLFDLRVIWLRKVWQFYKDKFDQRDDDNLRLILKAADEVVWSCYREVVNRAASNAVEFKQGPAPLPFIEDSYSPESFPSELVPYDLKPSETGFLQNLISRLPIPLVSLPQSCVNAPWWLVYVGHEIGHHVQYSFIDEQQFIKLFQTQVKDAVTNNGGVGDDADKWGRWSKEIFADIFSIMMMGQWAVWAMVDFELKKPNEMLVRRPQYPSPIVRLALLAHAADRLGLDGTGALRGLSPEQMAAGNEQAERDLSLVPHVVKSALSQLPEQNVTLARLAAFSAEDFLWDGDVKKWAEVLRRPRPIDAAEPSLRSPRLIASATLAAWANIVDSDDNQRKTLSSQLAKDSIDLIVQSREPGSREVAIEEKPVDLGEDLGKLLFQAGRNELEL